MKLFLLIILGIVATGCGVVVRYTFPYSIEIRADVDYLAFQRAQQTQPTTRP